MDSFSFGLTILETLDGTPEKIFGALSQTEIDQEIQQCRQRLHQTTTKKELNVKMAVLDIAQQLLKCDPVKRMSCSQAAHRLEIIAQTL